MRGFSETLIYPPHPSTSCHEDRVRRIVKESDQSQLSTRRGHANASPNKKADLRVLNEWDGGGGGIMKVEREGVVGHA